MNAPRLLSLLLRVHIPSVRHSFLGEIEIVSLRIVGTVGREGTIGWPLEDGDVGIGFLDSRNHLVDVVHINAEMMQPGHVARFSANHGHADVTVADADRVIGSNRFFFFCRAWLRSLHPKHRFVKLGLPHEVFTYDSRVLDSG
jgi:hypothetical protein